MTTLSQQVAESIAPRERAEVLRDELDLALANGADLRIQYLAECRTCEMLRSELARVSAENERLRTRLRMAGMHGDSGV